MSGISKKKITLDISERTYGVKECQRIEKSHTRDLQSTLEMLRVSETLGTRKIAYSMLLSNNSIRNTCNIKNYIPKSAENTRDARGLKGVQNLKNCLLMLAESGAGGTRELEWGTPISVDW